MVFQVVFNRVRRVKPIEPLEVVMLGVTGQYSAGKTFFSQGFAPWLANYGIAGHHIEGDMYFTISKPERNKMLAEFEAEGTYDERLPEVYTLDRALMEEHLEMMKARQDIHAEGLYQRSTGNLDRKFDLEFDDRPTWIIYDCVWGIEDPFRGYMDYIVFFTAAKDERIIRASGRALSAGHSYVQKPKKFDGIETFTGGILRVNMSPSFLYIDNTDYKNPKILENEKSCNI